MQRFLFLVEYYCVRDVSTHVFEFRNCVCMERNAEEKCLSVKMEFTAGAFRFCIASWLYVKLDIAHGLEGHCQEVGRAS